MIGIGIIGAGNRGLISLLADMPEQGAVIKAAADIHRPFLEEYQKQLGRKIFTTEDFRTLIKHPEVDAVMIFSPDYCHEEHALAAIEAGKDIFIEKPLALTVESCDLIIQKAEEAGVKIYVGHNMRHMFFLKKMKELVDSGIIGEVKAVWVRHFVSRGGDCYFKDWHAERLKSNSLLVHKGVHDFDAIHWLAGSESAKVQAMGALTLYGDIADRVEPSHPGAQDRSMDYWPPLSQKGLNPVIDVEDLAMVQIQLANGVLASYQQCHYTPDYWRNYTIIGTEGRIENFGTRTAGSEIHVYNRKQLYSKQGNAVYKLPEEYQNGDSPDLREIKEFVAFLKGETSPESNVQSARAAVAAADFATRSMRSGGGVQIVSEFVIDN